MRGAVEFSADVSVANEIAVVPGVSWIARSVLDVEKTRVPVPIAVSIISLPEATLLGASSPVRAKPVSVVIEWTSTSAIPVATPSASTPAPSISTPIRLAKGWVGGRGAGRERSVTRTTTGSVGVDTEGRLSWIPRLSHISEIPTHGGPTPRGRPPSSKSSAAVSIAIAPVGPFALATTLVPKGWFPAISKVAVSIAPAIPAVVPPPSTSATTTATAKIAAGVASAPGAVGRLDQRLWTSWRVPREWITEDIAVRLESSVILARLCR